MLPKQSRIDMADVEAMYNGKIQTPDYRKLYKLIYEQAIILANVAEEEWNKKHPVGPSLFD